MSGENLIYQEEKLWHLVSAIFLQAVVDAYSSDVIRRDSARVWLRLYGKNYLLDYELGIPVRSVEEWIKGGFDSGSALTYKARCKKRFGSRKDF